MQLALRESLLILSAAAALGFIYTAYTGKGIFAHTDIRQPAPTSQSTQAPVMISRDEAKAIFDSGPAFFVDARHAFDYKLGHIKGAVNIPLNEFDSYKTVIDAVPKDRPIVVYCDGAECNSSIELSVKLHGQGYTNLKIFFGGWREWEAAQFPVEQSQ